jgi:hypothetical protein
MASAARAQNVPGLCGEIVIDGKKLEGVGISPDIETPASDTYRPNDARLSRGIAVLLERLKAPK